MLAEARGFRLSLTLAHQNLGPTAPRAARRDLHQRPQQDHLHRRRPTTPATWPATPSPTSTSTTWPTSTPSTPPPAWSTTAPTPPPSPCAPDPSHRRPPAPVAARDRGPPPAAAAAAAHRSDRRPLPHSTHGTHGRRRPARRPRPHDRAAAPIRDGSPLPATAAAPQPRHARRRSTPARPTGTDRRARLARGSPRATGGCCAMLHEHRVLTTHPSPAWRSRSDPAPAAACSQLYRWDVLDRFAPHLPVGAAPMHYVLGPAGAAVLAAEHGLTPPRARATAATTRSPSPTSHTLAHTVARQRPVRPPHPPHPPTATRSATRPGLEPVGAGRCGWTAGGPRPAAAATSATSSAPTPTPASPPPPRTQRRVDGRVVFEWFLELDFATSTLDTLARQTRPLRPARRHHPAPPAADLAAHPAPAKPPPANASPRPADRRARAGAGRDLDRRDRRPPPTRPRHPRAAAQPGWRPGLPTRCGYRSPPRAARGGSTSPSSPALWPASPGHTLADEANTPAGTDLDLEPARPDAFPAPHPLPPIPHVPARSTREHR